MRSIPTILSLFFCVVMGYGQTFQIPDSLKDKTFKEIEDLSVRFYTDTVRFNIYADVLLAKAKSQRDSLSLVKGYRVVAFKYKNNPAKMIVYLDSSIAMNKGFVNSSFPAVTYLNLGTQYNRMGDHDKALAYCLKALKYSRKEDSTGFYYSTLNNIGNLKSRIGEYKEAAKIYKEVLRYENEKEITGKGHLITIMNLANIYRRLNLLDSATYNNKRGFQLANEQGLNICNSFTFNEGINLFYKKEYQASLDSIQKAMYLKKMDKTGSKECSITGDFYLSKLYKIFNDDKKSLEYLFAIEACLMEKEHNNKIDLHSAKIYREGYQMLIDYYKSKGDAQQQLYYINQLLRIDSIQDRRYKNLSKKLTKDYDTPNLLKEKEVLIASLEAEKQVTTNRNIVISALLAISMLGGGYYYYTQRRYKKRFRKLLDTVPAPGKPVKNTTSIVTIPQETREHLLAQLHQFEKQQGYLQPGINSKDLAKSLGSNSTYLSQVVNTYKGKNLNQYINELRIDYVVTQLQEDTRFRKFTIHAIAQEVGFNNAEVFTKAFYKKTGIYPSYFIKKLEQQGQVGS